MAVNTRDPRILAMCHSCTNLLVTPRWTDGRTDGHTDRQTDIFGGVLLYFFLMMSIRAKVLFQMPQYAAHPEFLFSEKKKNQN